MTLATWITFSRLLAIPILLIGLQPTPSEQARWFCLAIFLLAAGTDWLDGYLARKLNQVTELGKFLDPLVDKLLILAPLLGLIQLGQVSAWSVFLILLRELAIAGWRVNQTQVTGANLWGKGKTVSQILAVSLLVAPLSAYWQPWITLSYGVAIALTLISGLLYLWPRSAPSVAIEPPVQ
uniref:CDP-diacylglycerol--glycerol-3-phosphate 3-phosphatidyltransferase n=1 Tax=Cyanothece sp. (strain PCC 7425 / ATCC 29141) TaxID=395961 RepID=B8HMG3_CYAP4